MAKKRGPVNEFLAGIFTLIIIIGFSLALWGEQIVKFFRQLAVWVLIIIGLGAAVLTSIYIWKLWKLGKRRGWWGKSR